MEPIPTGRRSVGPRSLLREGMTETLTHHNELLGNFVVSVFSGFRRFLSASSSGFPEIDRIDSILDSSETPDERPDGFSHFGVVVGQELGDLSAAVGFSGAGGPGGFGERPSTQVRCNATVPNASKMECEHVVDRRPSFFAV